MDELAEVLARPKLQRYITPIVASEFVAGLATSAVIVTDAPPLPGVSPDADDDYLVALARSTGADYLVSGDPHLLGLADPDPTVLSPRQFVDLLTAGL